MNLDRNDDPTGRPSRVDTSAVEPRYLAALEAQRSSWWKSENFDTWKNLYVSEYARGHDIIDTLGRYVPTFDPSDSDILDIGCGDAGVAIAFAEHGARAAGIEPAPSSVQRGGIRAREHGVDVDLREGMAEELPFPDTRFDLVLLDNVLEHVGDMHRTLAEVRRVLRPDGLLYLVTPKPFALYSLWSDPHYELAGLTLMPRWLQVWYFERVRGGGRGAYQVGRIPTRWRVRRLLRRHGFEALVEPRELWIHYLRSRIGRPEEVKAGWKRRLATWLADRDWVFRNPVARWAWDVAAGSNFFVARRG